MPLRHAFPLLVLLTACTDREPGTTEQSSTTRATTQATDTEATTADVPTTTTPDTTSTSTTTTDATTTTTTTTDPTTSDNTTSPADPCAACGPDEVCHQFFDGFCGYYDDAYCIPNPNGCVPPGVGGTCSQACRDLCDSYPCEFGRCGDEIEGALHCYGL